MPRIPGLIEQDPNVRGAVPQQRADLETFAPGWRQVDTAIRTGGEIDQQVLGAEGRAAGSLAAIGEGIGDTAAYLQKRQVQDDVSTINQTAARARLEWTQHLNDKLANPPRDAAGNLQYQNIAQGTLDDFDAYSSKILDSGANTPEGQRYLAQQMAEMRTSLGEQAIVGQAHLAGVAHQESFAKTQASLTQAVRLDPTSAAPIIAQGLKAIEAEVGSGDLGPDGPKVASALRQKFLTDTVASAYSGLVDKDPDGLKAQLALPANQRQGFYKTLGQYSDGAVEDFFSTKADERIRFSDQQTKLASAEAKRAQNEASNQYGMTWLARLDSGESPANLRAELDGKLKAGALPGLSLGEASHLQSLARTLGEKGQVNQPPWFPAFEALLPKVNPGPGRDPEITDPSQLYQYLEKGPGGAAGLGFDGFRALEAQIASNPQAKANQQLWKTFVDELKKAPGMIIRSGQTVDASRYESALREAMQLRTQGKQQNIPDSEMLGNPDSPNFLGIVKRKWALPEGQLISAQANLAIGKPYPLKAQDATLAPAFAKTPEPLQAPAAPKFTPSEEVLRQLAPPPKFLAPAPEPEAPPVKSEPWFRMTDKDRAGLRELTDIPGHIRDFFESLAAPGDMSLDEWRERKAALNIADPFRFKQESKRLDAKYAKRGE